MTLLSYGPLFRDGFPLEQESHYFFNKIGDLSWPESAFFRMYYSILPLTNLLLKFAVTLCQIHKNLFFAVLLAAHLFNVFLMLRWSKTLFEWSHSPKEAGKLSTVTAILFSSFNAYYHLLANPSAGIALMFSSFALLSLFSWATRSLLSERELKAPWAALALSAVLPFNAFLSGILFLTLFLLVGVIRPKGGFRRIAPLLVANLIGIAIEVLFLDGRFSPFSAISAAGVYKPQNTGFTQALLANPALFGASVLNVAGQGTVFGLLFQNFLLFTSPFSLSYLVGALFAGATLISLVRCAPKARLLAGFAGGAILIYLLNASLMRNPLSLEPERFFDGFYVASMPRYYYLPSFFLALGVTAALHWLWVSTARMHRNIRYALIGGLTLFVALGANATLGKVFYLSEHMDSEIYEYVPIHVLRAPPTRPGLPSFLPLPPPPHR